MKIYKSSWGLVIDLEHIAAVDTVVQDVTPFFKISFVIGGSVNIYENDFVNPQIDNMRNEIIRAWEIRYAY